MRDNHETETFRLLELNDVSDTGAVEAIENSNSKPEPEYVPAVGFLILLLNKP